MIPAPELVVEADIGQGLDAGLAEIHGVISGDHYVVFAAFRLRPSPQTVGGQGVEMPERPDSRRKGLDLDPSGRERCPEETVGPPGDRSRHRSRASPARTPSPPGSPQTALDSEPPPSLKCGWKTAVLIEPARPDPPLIAELRVPLFTRPFPGPGIISLSFIKVKRAGYRRWHSLRPFCPTFKIFFGYCGEWLGLL